MCNIEATNLSKCVPLILHGDDAESHRRRSFMICSFASLLVKGSSPWESRLLCYCLDSFQNVWRNVEHHGQLDGVVPCRLMSGGIWTKDHGERLFLAEKVLEGKELAGGWRAVLCAHRGDEKYLAKAYHIGVSWLSQQVCWTCKASRMSTSSLYIPIWTKCAASNTFLTTSDFIQLCKPNPWVRLPGGHVDVMTYDLLHVFDLTLVPDAAASVLDCISLWVCMPWSMQGRCMFFVCSDKPIKRNIPSMQALVGIDQTDEVWAGMIVFMCMHIMWVRVHCVWLFTLIFCAFYSVCLFAGSTVDDRLQTAYAEFTKLCRTHKIRISFCMWTQYDTIMRVFDGFV